MSRHDARIFEVGEQLILLITCMKLEGCNHEFSFRECRIQATLQLQVWEVQTLRGCFFFLLLFIVKPPPITPERAATLSSTFLGA